MIEKVFIKRMNTLHEQLLDDYYNGDEMDGSIGAIILLCHNYIELGKMNDSKDKTKDKKY